MSRRPPVALSAHPVVVRAAPTLIDRDETMPKFSVRVPHNLSQAEAKERLGGFVDIIREKMQDKVSDLEQSWDGDTVNFRFKTYGIPLTGKIAVAEKELVVDGELPFTAMMFKGQIESTIHKYLGRLVGSEEA